MRLCFRIPFCALLSLPVLAPSLHGKGEAAGTYVVLMVTDSEGKISYKPIADKDRTSYQKSLEEGYQKAKRAYQEEKKAAEKNTEKNPEKKKGESFDKSEPVKPKISVQKRDIKTFNEAKKIAFDLEREQEQKSKNGKGQKNGNGGGEKNGGDKNGKEKKPGGKAA